jgi:hypothetical protein
VDDEYAVTAEEPCAGLAPDGLRVDFRTSLISRIDTPTGHAASARISPEMEICREKLRVLP